MGPENRDFLGYLSTRGGMWAHTLGDRGASRPGVVHAYSGQRRWLERCEVGVPKNREIQSHLVLKEISAV